MFTLTRNGPVVTVACTRCSTEHRGNDRTARTFKLTHDCSANPEGRAA